MFGVAENAESGAFSRFDFALQHEATLAFGGLLNASARNTKALFRIKAFVGRAQAETAAGNFANASPLAGNGLEDLANELLRGTIPFLPNGTTILVLDFGAAVFQLLDAHQDSLQDIQRFKPRNHDRHAVLRRERQVFFIAHDGANMTGSEKPLHAAIGRAKNRLDSRRNQNVRHEKRKVSEIFLRSLVHCHRRSRSSGFEANAKEHDLALGGLFRQFYSIERRIDNAHIAATSFDREQITMAAGHPEHVAEGTKDRFGSRGDFHRFIDELNRRDAHRATRPMNEGNLFGQQLIEPELHDSMGLPAADLHQRPGPGRDASDLARILSGGAGITILVQVLHSKRLD